MALHHAHCLNGITCQSGFIELSCWFMEFLWKQVLLKLATMEVEIKSRVTISCNGAKAVAIPPALIVEHDGSQWLKLRPTNYQLNQLFCGAEIKANASFSNHPGFQDFITKRNEAWLKLSTMSDQDQDGQDDEANGKPNKRRRVAHPEASPEVVEVPLNDTNIQRLMQGQKPTRSDVVAPLAKSSWNHFLFCSRTARTLWNPGSHTTRSQPKRHRPLTCSTCLLGRKMILKPAILGSAFIGVGSHPWHCIGVWFGIWHGMLHIVISCHLVYSTSEWNTIWSVTSP